ncbi:threonine ammonia-lyase IlvA [Aureisphaera galaxeae]|uniref:threonine ammonia-lyase IlvA n=1 Tax=Aureisphaera galaxeae TaxID=1538023 RepID=UPI002350D868|nr:threonine ammonia-lyase IlvA [Aureisphaera galaxeae]MDC8003142.1 threonine ammonia-lyase IlvA [Aureisphaera galaxeae]
MEVVSIYRPTVTAVEEAASLLEGVVVKTPLLKSQRHSRLFGGDVYLKREDLQPVRSYKIRGAYHKMATLVGLEREQGVICASAGNHAQGVALSCKLLKVKGTIYMPATTPMQKIEQVQHFGEGYVEVCLEGDTFDDAYGAAMLVSKAEKKTFIHPFDDEKVIEGQGTIGLEILEQSSEPLDYVFVPVGGGGLAAGLSSVFQQLSPSTKIIGVEPEGAPAMKRSIEQGKNVYLPQIEKFVDGAAVKQVGERNFQICKDTLHEVITVPEGKICETLLELYNKDGIIVEPAGALSVAALDYYSEEIKGKKVACVVSGSNNDITRTAEIKERALLYANVKHYFIVKFPQRAGALRQFLTQVLGPEDDITYFEYTKKTNRSTGSAVVGLELKSPEDFEPLVARMKAHQFYQDYLNDKPELFQFLV